MARYARPEHDDLVVIFAGYPDEMEKLLAMNPGMRSRVPYTIEFPNYTREDLFQIFVKMSANHFDYTAGFEDHARDFFLRLPEKIISEKSFGNARFVRNIYERVWGKAVSRCAKNGNANVELTVVDFDDAIHELRL